MLRLRCCALAVVVWCAAGLFSTTATGAQALSLDDVVARALQLAPALDAASANRDLNDARVSEARAPLYPTIAGNGEYFQAPGYDQTISNRGLTLAQLALGYTAYDGGRRSDQVRAARYSAQAAALGVEAARALIVFDATVAYFDLVRTRAIEAELKSNLERLSKYVTIIDALQRSGRAIANDVLRLRATRDAAEITLAQARQAAAHASIVLGSMIGEYDQSDLQAAEVSGLLSWPNGDIGETSALKAAQRQVESAKLAVAAARAESSPMLKLALTAGYEGIDPPKTFGHHLGASYDGAVSLPIFQGGLVQSHIDEAMAAEHTALAQQHAVELGLKRDYADAAMRYRAAREQLDLLARSRTTSDDAFALDWARFLGGGNVTLLEVIDAYGQAENLRVARFDQDFAARQAAAQGRLLLGLSR